MSSLTLPVLLIFIIVIYNLSSVSSDCGTCCLLGTGCSTAYNGESGQCCGQGLSSYCCPTSSVCLGNYKCRLLYFGMSLEVLIGVIVGIIIGGSLLITLFCRLCRTRTVTNTMVLTPTYRNPGVYEIPSPAVVSYNY